VKIPAIAIVIAGCACAAVAIGCASGGASKGKGTTSSSSSSSGGGGATTVTGGAASDFTLRDTEGRQVHLSDYLGKEVILIDFWATWCVPCEAELPHLEALYKQYKDQGFVVLGISMDGPETVAQVQTYARRYELSFPVLLDEETKVVGVYNPKRTAPLSVLVNRSGQIAQQRQGYSAGDEKLIEEDVKNLLK
jgi:peroxiredoxin